MRGDHVWVEIMVSRLPAVTPQREAGNLFRPPSPEQDPWTLDRADHGGEVASEWSATPGDTV